MIALHAALGDGFVHLWGESSQAAKPARSRRKSALHAHPFAVSESELSAALGFDWVEDSVALPRSTVWLPTLRDRPVASHPLVGEPPEADEAMTLSPWKVPTVALEVREAVGLLGQCREEPLLRPGVLIGSTLAYWAKLFRATLGLVVRGQYYPGVDDDGDSFRAVWRPQLVGPECRLFRDLAAAMPAACRTMTDDAKASPRADPRTAVNDFLHLFVDFLVRSSQPKPTRPKQFDSVQDQWLHALRDEGGTLSLTGQEFRKLSDELEAWRHPLTLSASSAFRLTFRLEEPAGAEEEVASTAGNWTVRYFLQSDEDPSLLVPLSDLVGGKRKASLRDVKLPSNEFILASLGRAAKLSPEVDATLKSSRPSQFTLDTAGAHRFLSEMAFVFQQAGFGVLLPSWWTRTGTKQLFVSAHAKTTKKFNVSSGTLSLDTIVKFDWQVAIGDLELTPEELEALAKLKSPLVQIRGQWVQVNSQEIQNALDFWKKHPKTEGTLRDALQLTIGAAAGPNGLPVREVKAGGQLGEFLARLRGDGTMKELPAPAGFRGTLRPYQLRGYSWLTFLRRCGLGACLADDMGLGKSAQMLASILGSRDDGESKPILLVCPTSVVGHWRKESERFAPSLKVMIHHGLTRTKGENFTSRVQDFDLIVTSFQLLLRDAEAFQKVGWGGVVLDEAQNIKNPDAKTSHAARGLTSDFRVALTGTPVENHLGDLWSISEFLNPGLLGKRTPFRRDFIVPIQTQNDTEAAARLKRLTGPFLLRRLKTDKTIIADLPEKLETKVYCTLTKEQASLYAAVVRELDSTLNDKEGISRKGAVLALLSRLKQVCNHPAQFLGDNSEPGERSGKLNRLTEMLGEVLEAGDRALIFTQFTEMGDLLKRHLQETFGREVMFLHGGVSQPKREQMVTRFQHVEAPDAPRLFLISLKAGGTGLTLTAANHVFHFDRWWNPAVENQATDRAFRIGQTRTVQVHKFVCVGTLEERIDDMIERKKEIAQRVVGTGEGWLTELSNKDIKELIQLRDGAVEE